jgi:hypothetical protein
MHHLHKRDVTMAVETVGWLLRSKPACLVETQRTNEKLHSDKEGCDRLGCYAILAMKAQQLCIGGVGNQRGI